MQFKPPGPHVQSRPKRSTSQFKLPELESPVVQFKPPGPPVQSRSRRSTSQFKSLGRKNTAVRSRPKRSTSQFKFSGPIIRSNIYAPSAHGIFSPLITMPVRLEDIVEQPTLKVQTPIQSTQTVTQSAYVDLSINETSKSISTGIDNHLVWIIAVACGLLMANLIYLQPLLANMGQSFRVSADQIGLTATFGLLGYALGLIFIVPLGEKYNRHRLIVILLGAATIALVTMAMAPSVALLTIASCAVGLASVTPELIIPFAASLAPAKERGRVVGILLCGMFICVPLASMLSGFVGKYLGWRSMYWIAAGITIALALVLHLVLPNSRSAKSTKEQMSYPQLLGSLWKLLCSEPVLQEASILAVLVYGAFTAFWTTLSFVLETTPYHYGSEVAGLFGLVGISGAIAALFVGKFADRQDARYATGAAIVLALLAFVVMWLVGQWFIGLIIGAILLDVGAQSHEAANEIRIYSLESTAWTRLNTIFIFFFCLGGSLGSALGTLGWRIAKQNGVYGIACLMLLVALVFYALHSKRIRQWRKRLDQ